VAEKLGVANSKITHNAETEDDEDPIVDGSIGIEITGFKRTQTKATQIVKLIDPVSKYKAWFGYDFSKRPRGETTTNLAVWFYCRRKSAAEAVKRKIGNPPPGWNINPPQKPAEAERHYLYFSKPAARAKKDFEEFLALIGRVIPQTTN
jgi:hypothetical protein